MQSILKITETSTWRYFRPIVFLLIAIFFNTLILTGQTRQSFGVLSQDGNIYHFSQTDHNDVEDNNNPSSVFYYDFEVPPAGSMPYLSLTARGGDGGKWEIKDIFGHTVRTGQGGQGAFVSAVFKIGTGANELKPGSTLRFIVGQKGRSGGNCWGCLGSAGGGGGGGTGVIYLPVGANQNEPSNWKILLVAGGGGGGFAGTNGYSDNGNPGEITEDGNRGMDNLTNTDNSIYNCGTNGYGGYYQGGGGTDIHHGDAYSSSFNYETLNGFGRGLYQQVNGVTAPIGGMGGALKYYGGYGLGSGGGSDKATTTTGGGGGYSGGFSSWTLNSHGGGGGGSYINSTFLQPATGVKVKNGTTNNPGNGYVDYQLTSTNPVATQGLYFQADKGTQVEVLKTNGWTLRWQYDCNLVLYQNGVAKWASGTNNKGTALRFQGDGNLVIYNNGVAVWASATANNQHGGKGGRYLVLTPEGSLFIIDQDGKVIWKGH